MRRLWRGHGQSGADLALIWRYGAWYCLDEVACAERVFLDVGGADLVRRAQALEAARSPAPIWPDDEAAHVAETVDELRETDAPGREWRAMTDEKQGEQLWRVTFKYFGYLELDLNATFYIKAPDAITAIHRATDAGHVAHVSRRWRLAAWRWGAAIARVTPIQGAIGERGTKR